VLCENCKALGSLQPTKLSKTFARKPFFLWSKYSPRFEKDPNVWLWRWQKPLGIFVLALTYPQPTAWEHSGTDIA